MDAKIIISDTEPQEINGMLRSLTYQLVVEKLREIFPNYHITTFKDERDGDRLTIVISDK